MEQRSDLWFAERAGKFTGSRFDELMRTTKKGPSRVHFNVIAKVAIERITGQHFEKRFRSHFTDRGAALEEEARQAYEAQCGFLTESVDIVKHPTLPYVSVSPDALCRADGLLEIKCPDAEGKHIEALLKAAHAKEYRWQLQGQLWVTGRKWVDAVSYDPRFPETMRLAIKRVFPCEEDFAALEKTCIASDAEVCDLIRKLQEVGDGEGKKTDKAPARKKNVTVVEGTDGAI